MSLMIAIKSCHAHRNLGMHETIRQTWGKTSIPVQFFMGLSEISSPPFKSDESILGVDDSYHSLPQKTKAICKEFLDYWGYTHMLLADTDTFIDVPRLLNSGFEKYDYMGVNTKLLGQTFPYHAFDRDSKDHFNAHTWPWMSGGYGYFLSRKGAEYVTQADPSEWWAEDMMVGAILGPLFVEGKIVMANMIRGTTWHAPREYNTTEVQKWIHKMYKEVNR